MLSLDRAPRRTGARLLMVVLTLGGGVLAADESMEAPVAGVGAGTGMLDAEVKAQAQVEDLGQLIQGMEGKLRESAAARKAADQARMEAERHLAEAAQESARLRAEVNLLRDANLALEARLERAERDRRQTAALGLAPGDAAVSRRAGERDARAAQPAVIDRQLDHPTGPQERGGEAGLERLRTLIQEQTALRRSLAERESDLKRTQLELRAVQAERDALRRQLDLPRLTSPVGPTGDLQEGLTLAQVLAEADAAARTLRSALVEVRSSRAGEARRAVREAAHELERLQLRVARLRGARGVYRVGPGDTYALIAGRFYGDGRRWSEIQAANRGVAPDPSHLVPGLTLVIP